MNSSSPFLLILLFALVPASGCVTETVEEPRGGGIRILDFENTDLRSALVRSGVYHGVELLFELDPTTDLPEVAPGQPQEFNAVVIPYTDGFSEVYRVFDGLHQVTYRVRTFEVGGFHYPAEPGSSLYVFKPRSGDFEFTFHGQRIAIESGDPWIPSIWYHIAYERPGDEGGRAMRGGRGPITAIRETLQVGLARIETDSTQSTMWLVDGKPYVPGNEDTLRIRGATDFDVGK